MMAIESGEIPDWSQINWLTNITRILIFFPHSVRIYPFADAGMATDRQQQHSSVAESGNNSVDDANPVELSSKSREVSPILVVAGKKYGRRSRPQSAATFGSSSSHSDSDASEGGTVYDNTSAMGSDRSSKSQKVCVLCDIHIIYLSCEYSAFNSTRAANRWMSCRVDYRFSTIHNVSSV